MNCQLLPDMRNLLLQATTRRRCRPCRLGLTILTGLSSFDWGNNPSDDMSIYRMGGTSATCEGILLLRNEDHKRGMFRIVSNRLCESS